jgi:flagellar hook-basal body complex protein FliE
MSIAVAAVSSTIAPIGSIGSLPVDNIAGAAGAGSGTGFGASLLKGLDSVATMERQADRLVKAMAAGEPVQIHEIMAATSKANLGMTIVNEVRTKALEAYQSILNIQI